MRNKHSGETINEDGEYKSMLHYCDYPGERLIKEVRFEVNGTVLDKYDTHAYVFRR